MSETKFGIPRMTVAVMVFGGLGCGNDESVSDTARIQKIAEDECKAEFTCQDASHDPTDYATQQECVDFYVNKLASAYAKVTPDCKEAALEYYECYEALGCGGDTSKCAKLNATYQTKCKDMVPATTK